MFNEKHYRYKKWAISGSLGKKQGCSLNLGLRMGINSPKIKIHYHIVEFIIINTGGHFRDSIQISSFYKWRNHF